MRQMLTAAFLMMAMGGSALGDSVNIRAIGTDDPRVAWGVEQLESALADIKYKTSEDGQVAPQIAIDATGKELDVKARKPEGYRLLAEGNHIRIVGYDAAGAMYGCLDLAGRVRALKRLPDRLDVSEGPAMSLRGTCILLMKLGHYTWEVSPKEFPFLYDKKQWVRYLDFLATNRFNYIAFW